MSLGSEVGPCSLTRDPRLFLVGHPQPALPGLRHNRLGGEVVPVTDQGSHGGPGALGPLPGLHPTGPACAHGV